MDAVVSGGLKGDWLAGRGDWLAVLAGCGDWHTQLAGRVDWHTTLASLSQLAGTGGKASVELCDWL